MLSVLQEKMKSKNKLVPRLLGITKESVMRVDERTKDVVQEWPLTTVKRWAASPKSFTLVRFITEAPEYFSPEFTSFWYFWLCSFSCFILYSICPDISLVVNKEDRPDCSLQWP